MTTTKLELVLNVHLGSAPTVYRPSATTEASQPGWVPIEEDSILHLLGQEAATLRLRLVAHDAAGNPVEDPAWMVTAYTRTEGGQWSSLTDRDSNAAHFLTDHFAVDEERRLYRFAVSIPGSGIAAYYELSIARHDPQSPEEPDVVYDPEDDFTDHNNPGGNTPPEERLAGDLGVSI